MQLSIPLRYLATGLGDCLPVVSLLLNSTSTCTERCDLAAILSIIVSSLNEELWLNHLPKTIIELFHGTQKI